MSELRRALAALLLLAACSSRTHSGLPDVVSFKVELNHGAAGLGTPDQRLPLKSSDGFTVTATALDRDGNAKKDFNGTASLRVTPGRLYDSRQLLQFKDGVAQGSVTIQNTFGKTLLWVEARTTYGSDKKPIEGTYGTGVSPPIWYSSATFYDIQKVTTASDLDALPNSYISVSEDSLSPGKQMDIVVTAVFQDGFYATDLKSPADPDISLPHAFGHMYVYSYSFPEDLVPGDRLGVVTGTISEFSGDTQLTFPSWSRKVRPDVSLDELRKAIPPPVDLDRTMCEAVPNTGSPQLCGVSKDNLTLESQESGPVILGRSIAFRSADLCDPEAGVDWGSVVKFRSFLKQVPGMDASLWTDKRIADVCPLRSGAPSQFLNCDINRDGKIPFPSSSTGDCKGLETEVLRLECECKSACDLDPSCAEQSNLRLYGQWGGALVNTNGDYDLKVGLVTNLAVPDWIPEEHPNIRLRVRGQLRQVRAARPPWQVVAAESDDLCCIPDDPTDEKACPTAKRCP